MAGEPDRLALELERLAREFRPLLPGPAPEAPPPPEPRDFHAALWGFLIAAGLAMIFFGLAGGAAVRWAMGLPILGGN